MSVLAFDTETYLIAEGRLAPKPVCVSFQREDDLMGSVYPAKEGADVVAAHLLAGGTVVGHNTAYDMAVLLNYNPGMADVIWNAYSEGRVLCTMVTDILCDIAVGNTHNRSYTLARLVDNYLDEQVAGKDTDGWRLRYRELDGVPISQWPTEAVAYARLDAEYTLRVFKCQRANGIPQDAAPQARASWALHLMGCWGLRTDPVAVADLRNKLQASVTAASLLLRASGIQRANGTKDMKVIRNKVEAAYNDAPPLTEKGAIKTCVQTLRNSKDPDLIALADVSADAKELSTYLPIVEKGTKLPINPRWLVLKDTGRTGCMKPSLQNQPRRAGVRECYVPREGWLYAAADYHVAELCALGQVCIDLFGHSRLADIINEGGDPHLLMASSIKGWTYDETVKRFEEGDKEVKKARQLAKAANFGYPGGLGSATFVAFCEGYGLTLSEDDAKALKRVWMETYPEMAEYFQAIGDLIEADGGATTIEQLRSGRERGACGYTQACNTLFQGLVADGAKHALWLVQRECYHAPGSPLYGSRPVAFIHDEIIMESPADKAAEAAERLSAVMVEGMKVFIPDVNIRADAHLMARWYKSAEPVRNDAGVLIPWEPTA